MHTIIFNGKCEVGHKSGLRFFDGAHENTLEKLRQIWSHRGDKCVATCLNVSTNSLYGLYGK